MAMNTNTSSKYDYITCKEVVKQGSPAVYQLKTVEDTVGTLQIITFGTKDPNKTNKTILLVGETGTGKSTLINALVNFTMGVQWEDDVWFQMVQDRKEDDRCQSESQTSDVIMYQIFGFEGKTLPYSLTIIDTPGYGHTSGIEHDVIISERLLNLFRSDNGVHEIDAVGLVLKATENRLSDRLSYIFDSAVSLFGKDMEKNIVALITHSDGRKPKNALKALEAANITCARNKNNQPTHFLFDNIQHEDRAEDMDALKRSYEIATKGMRQLADFLDKTATQKLETTVDVLIERIRLTASIQNLRDRIEFIELKHIEIQQNQELLKEYEKNMKENENFTVKTVEVYKGKETISGRATCCTSCKENCHYPGCTVAWGPGCCKVMESNHCTVCIGRCPVSRHVKENWRFVNKSRKVEKILHDVKDKYEKNKKESEKKLSLLEILEKKRQYLLEEKDQWLEESFKHIVRLDQIALNADSLSTHVHLDFLIEKMKEKGDEEKVPKLEEIKNRAGKGTASGLQYIFGKLVAFGKAVKESP